MFQKWKGQKPETPEVSQGAHEMGAPRPAEASAAPAADWGEPASNRAEHGPKGHAEVDRLALASRSMLGGGAPRPHRALRGWAPNIQVEQREARSAYGAEPGGHRPSAWKLGAQPRKARPLGTSHSDGVGSAMTPQLHAAHGPGIQPGLRAGASSALAPDDRRGERSESQGPKPAGAPDSDLYHLHESRLQVQNPGGDTGSDPRGPSTLEIGRARVQRILALLHRFGPLTKRALLAHLLNCQPYSPTQDASLRRTLSAMQRDRLIVETNQPSPKKELRLKQERESIDYVYEESKRKSGLPSVYVLARAGARKLATFDMDFIEPVDLNHRASDIHVPDTWAHDEIAAFTAAQLAAQGIRYITDKELRYVVGKSDSAGRKVPDLLAYIDSVWVMVEVEWSKKYGKWLGQQARMMAIAKEEGFWLADRWFIADSISVTTSFSESPTPQFLTRSLSPYVTKAHELIVWIFEATYGVVQNRYTETRFIVRPRLGPDDIKVQYGRYGENYVGEVADQLSATDANTWHFVAQWQAGHFTGRIEILHPRGSVSATHRTSLNYRGRKVVDHAELNFRVGLDQEAKEALIRITHWGSIYGESGAHRVLAELRRENRLPMSRYLRYFRSWLRKEMGIEADLSDDA